MAVKPAKQGGGVINEALLRNFAPVIGPGAHTLILGTMPGKASLDASQYYAHPRNQFWPIMGDLFGAAPDLPYALRLDRLKASGIALWDMVESCTRRTSLDSDIRDETICDIPGLLAAYPHIRAIAFNGQKSRQFFQRRYAAAVAPRITLHTLPSTSPANAGMSYDRKLETWRRALLGK